MNHRLALTVNAEDLLKTLAVDSSYYESCEDWDMLDEVISLFKFVNKNAKDGLVTVTQFQLIEAGVY
jgi:hypothetical protein